MERMVSPAFIRTARLVISQSGPPFCVIHISTGPVPKVPLSLVTAMKLGVSGEKATWNRFRVMEVPATGGTTAVKLVSRTRALYLLAVQKSPDIAWETR